MIQSNSVHIDAAGQAKRLFRIFRESIPRLEDLATRIARLAAGRADRSTAAYQMEDFELVALRNLSGFAMIAFDQASVQFGDDVGEGVSAAPDDLGDAELGFRIFFLLEIDRHDHG